MRPGVAAVADIQISLNGAPHVVPAGTTIAALLEDLQTPIRFVAVERNRQLVPRREHARVVLESGDQLEIVTLVGGG
jgi:thiamine biosynthesis protein ThiS